MGISIYSKAMKFIKEKNEAGAIDDMDVSALEDLARETIRHVTDDPNLPDDQIEIWSASV